MRMAPLADALERDLQGGGLRARRLIPVLEDVTHLGVEIAVEADGTEGLGQDGLGKAKTGGRREECGVCLEECGVWSVEGDLFRG
jgi:hypothetical protein